MLLKPIRVAADRASLLTLIADFAACSAFGASRIATICAGVPVVRFQGHPLNSSDPAC